MSEDRDSRRRTPPLLENPLLQLMREQNQANGTRIGQLEARIDQLEHAEASDAEQVKALREENEDLRAHLDRLETDLRELGLISKS